MVNMDQLWPALVAIYNENPWKFMSDGRAVYYGEQYGWKAIAKHVLQKRARDLGQALPDDVAINIVNMAWGDDKKMYFVPAEELETSANSRAHSDASRESTSDVDPPSDFPDSD